MSLVLTMTSLAILAGLSLTELSAVAVGEIVSGKKKAKLEEGLETVYTDSTILYNTLLAYDCHVERVSENDYLVETESGKLRYYRANPNSAFNVYFDRIDNPDALLRTIHEFDREYGRNVQDFTYHHIKENLADNMRIYDEQVEGDDLLLTISID